MKALRYGLFLVIVVAIASVVIAQTKESAGLSSPAATMNHPHKVLDPANLEWGDPPPGLPPGAKVAVLSGDPAKKGVFTVRMRAPTGYKILPHRHLVAEHITVLSGSFHMGTGEKFDESAGHRMSPGSFMAMPAGQTHFAWTTEESVIQVHAEGPFEIVYVNPADDPRNAKK